MPTLYFAYAGPVDLDGDAPRAAPWTITFYAGRYLRERAADMGYAFRLLDMTDDTPLALDRQDIIIGHPWWGKPNTPMHQAWGKDIRAIIHMHPFTPIVTTDKAEFRRQMDAAHWRLLITGPLWWDRTASSEWAEYRLRSTRLDMAVDADRHPFVKTTYSPPGKRRALVIGHDAEYKGNDRIARLARLTGIELGHVGTVSHDIFDSVPHVRRHGPMHLTPDRIAYLCREYDFFISMGRWDANPTTLLETAAWGLIGFSTPGSGYYANEPFIGLRDDDDIYNMRQIATWQNKPVAELQRHAQRVRSEVEQCYHWQRFTNALWGGVLNALDGGIAGQIQARGVLPELGYTGHGWGIEQNPYELGPFIDAMTALNVKTVLELGTARGGLARLLTEHGFRVTSVDVRQPENLHTAVNFIQATTVKAYEQLREQRFDLVFIDADHAYRAALQDYHLYAPLATKAVALHDIAHPAFTNDTGRLWREVAYADSGLRRNAREFVAAGRPIGIGVLEVGK